MPANSKKCNSSLSYSLTRHSCHKMNSLPLALHFVFAWNYCFQNEEEKKRIVAFKRNLLCNWQKVTKGLLRKAARHIVLNSTINHLITKECNTNGQDIWLRLACYLGSVDILIGQSAAAQNQNVMWPDYQTKDVNRQQFFQMQCCRNVPKSCGDPTTKWWA